jgi:hypothetical protein
VTKIHFTVVFHHSLDQCFKLHLDLHIVTGCVIPIINTAFRVPAQPPIEILFLSSSYPKILSLATLLQEHRSRTGAKGGLQ